MRQDLLTKTAICSGLFAVVALGAIFYVGGGRAFGMSGDSVTVGEGKMAADENGGGYQPDNEGDPAAGQALLFDGTGSDTDYLRIPLPEGLDGDEVMVENHYMEEEMWVVLPGAPAAFYETESISGNTRRIRRGSFEADRLGVILKFTLNDIYEYRSILEDNSLYIEFIPPRESYERIIVIDPAWGGSETGAAYEGLREKDITLAVAEKLKARLDETDIKVYYTRIADNNPTEENRVRIANSTRADMLIRIEASADEDGMVHGTTAVYNESFFIPGFGSIELADLLEKEVVSNIKGKAVGLQAALDGDYVVKQATVPAAVIKVGYLTNAQEAILLQKDDYLDKIAEGIFRAIMKGYEGK